MAAAATISFPALHPGSIIKHKSKLSEGRVTKWGGDHFKVKFPAEDETRFNVPACWPFIEVVHLEEPPAPREQRGGERHVETSRPLFQTSAEVFGYLMASDTHYGDVARFLVGATRPMTTLEIELALRTEGGVRSLGALTSKMARAGLLSAVGIGQNRARIFELNHQPPVDAFEKFDSERGGEENEKFNDRMNSEWSRWMPGVDPPRSDKDKALQLIDEFIRRLKSFEYVICEDETQS